MPERVGDIKIGDKVWERSVKDITLYSIIKQGNGKNRVRKER